MIAEITGLPVEISQEIEAIRKQRIERIKSEIIKQRSNIILVFNLSSKFHQITLIKFTLIFIC